MSIRRTFLDAAPVARAILAAEQVAHAWASPSALPEMTVGSLAGHLVRAVTSVDAYLDAPVDDEGTPLDAAGYFGSIEGLRVDEPAALDSDLHRAIRKRSEAEAAVGQGGLVARWDEALARLADRLPQEPTGRRLPALGGRIIGLDEYLATRLVEITVHSDDLAVSVGLAPPEFDAEAMGIVIGTLVEMARRDHGDLAVVRALARRERDVVGALRVL